MVVSRDKKYTWKGKPFTVLTTTSPGSTPVVGHDAEGRIYLFNSHGQQYWNASVGLVEVSPYADFVIDEPVMVRNFDTERWGRALFVAASPFNGCVEASTVPAWVRGKEGRGAQWVQCRRPTKEELAK